MGRRPLFLLVFPGVLLITIAALSALTFASVSLFRSFQRERTVGDLEARAGLLALNIQGLLAAGDEQQICALCREAGTVGEIRVSLIMPDGRVACDSVEDPARMENHADRPEFRTALAGRLGNSVRHSTTLDRDLLYVTRRIDVDNRPAAVIRVSLPLATLSATLRLMALHVSIAGLALALMAGVVGYLVSRSIVRPLEDLRCGAARIAGGDIAHRIHPSGSLETVLLANSLNHMADQLSERIGTVVRQRNELSAVLESMAEGVIAVDSHERILSLNTSALRLLGVSEKTASGRTVPEVFRNPDLHVFVAAILAERTDLQTEIELHGGSETSLLVHGTVLRDAAGGEIGALIVLQDVTRLRRLEQVRRDFVANVSHELRTPVTSIKGFVETLRDGALDDPEAAGRFLRIVAGQAERLDAIINDLLTLSRLEQEGRASGIPLAEGAVRAAIDEAVELCSPRAEKKRIEIEVDCPGDLSAPMNQSLLVQALVNLIDNAVSYSGEGTTVRVHAATENGEVAISVADRGVGIAREHLPRIFERFYRVDKGRSRKDGGTGLGLAIVKHIAQVHRGRIEVESAPGAGSTFRLRWPAA